MCGFHTHPETAKIVENQVRETVKETKIGTPLRLCCLTCPCGWKRSIILMYKCLYCKVYFCTLCAEKHFGKTVEEYRNENSNI